MPNPRPLSGEKQCSKCKQELPLENFVRDARLIGGRGARCLVKKFGIERVAWFSDGVARGTYGVRVEAARS